MTLAFFPHVFPTKRRMKTQRLIRTGEMLTHDKERAIQLLYRQLYWYEVGHSEPGFPAILVCSVPTEAGKWPVTDEARGYWGTVSDVFFTLKRANVRVCGRIVPTAEDLFVARTENKMAKDRALQPQEELHRRLQNEIWTAARPNGMYDIPFNP